MSSTTIITFVFVGIIALLFVGYINQLMEKNKLEKARRKADLLERYRRCANLSESFPGQLMSIELKQLFNRIELNFIEQLAAVDVRDAKYTARAEELREWIAKGDQLTINNPPVTIINDQQTKEVRFQLEGLQAQIIRAVEDKILSTAQGQQWLAQVKHMLVTTYIDYFNNVGGQYAKQGLVSQARLVFERAVQYLKKQKDPTLYQQQLSAFETLLEQANDKMQKKNSDPNAQQTTELVEGLESQDQSDEWKKKQFYD